MQRGAPALIATVPAVAILIVPQPVGAQRSRDLIAIAGRRTACREFIAPSTDPEDRLRDN